MSNKKSIFICFAHQLFKLRNPLVYFWVISVRHFWHINTNISCPQFIFKPGKPSLFGIATPTVNYENSFLHKIVCHRLCPWHESNMHLRLSSPLLYPLSYGGRGDGSSNRIRTGVTAMRTQRPRPG